MYLSCRGRFTQQINSDDIHNQTTTPQNKETNKTDKQKVVLNTLSKITKEFVK